jgi:hypothetical protein
MKVIRQLTYEHNRADRLADWIALSRPDGADTMLPGLTVETVHSDIGTDKEIRASHNYDRQTPWEGERGAPVLTSRQLHLLWAVLEIKALDAEHGDHDDGLVEFELLTDIPTAEELRGLAEWAKGFLTPDMGSDS